MQVLGALFALVSLPCASSDDLDEFIRKEMSAGKIPGLSAVVVRKDEVLWQGQYGSALPSSSVEVPVERDTVFEVASLSKTIIGLAVLKLTDLGLLHPDDDINKHMPFPVRNPSFPLKPITLHGLLTHTSSICDDAYDDLDATQLYSEGDPKMSMETFYKRMLSPLGVWYSEYTFLVQEPQTGFEYSNIAASLAGYIAERVAQQAGIASSYDDFVRKHVLAPLGITRAGYYVSDFGGEQSLAPPLGAIPSDKKTFGGFKSYCFYSFPDYPDGAFKTSALDYAKLLGAVANGGTFQGIELLKQDTVDYLRRQASSPCAPLPCGGDLPQGNAFWYYKSQLGRSMLGHNGGEMGIATEAFWNVETGVGYVILSNGDWGGARSAYGKAFEAIEQKLLEQFDVDGPTIPGVDMVEASNQTRGRRIRANNQCPCGLPCNGVASQEAVV
jgi:CubicO group peptidase (beta-lactamase class C family)